MLLRTFQVLAATLLLTGAIIGSLWVLGILDPVEAKTSFTQIGGVLGVCLIAALLMLGIFSIGASKNHIE